VFKGLMQSVLFFCFFLEVIYRPVCAGDSSKGHIASLPCKVPIFFGAILN